MKRDSVIHMDVVWGGGGGAHEVLKAARSLRSPVNRSFGHSEGRRATETDGVQSGLAGSAAAANERQACPAESQTASVPAA